MRLLLGAVFLYAGAIKLRDPQSFADSIATFRLLPEPLINPLALGLPDFELAVGLLLICGWLRRIASLAALCLTGVFAIALTSSLARGLPVDCGCFGSGVPSLYQGWISLGRDLILAALAANLYLRNAAAAPAAPAQ
jgi:uncharacterized membrane protein YphA (DoxX/SURF4 family)